MKALPPYLVRILQITVGIVIAGGGMTIFMRDVDIDHLGRELGGYRVSTLVICGALAVLSLWFRAIRWRIMLPTTPGSSKRNIFKFVVVSFMINNIVPARLGEAVRVLLLWKKNHYSPATAIGALVLERGIDMVVFIAFFFIPVFGLPQLAPLRPYAWPLVGLFALVMLGAALLAKWPQQLSGLLLGLAAKLPSKVRTRVETMLQHVLSNLDWLRSPGKVAGVAFFSALTSLCYAFMIFVLTTSQPAFGLLGSMFSQAYATVGAAIPLSPGYVGTLHAMLLQGLTQAGIEAQQARAIAILYHALGYLPVTALGLFYFFRIDIRFADITRAQQQFDTAPPPPKTPDLS